MMDEQEKQRIIAETIAQQEAKRKQEVSDRMKKLGRIRSAKKTASSRNNQKAACEAKFGRPYGYRKPKDKK
jgi:hypothetical protein